MYKRQPHVSESRDSCFFFHTEDGIRESVASSGLGDVNKKQHSWYLNGEMKAKFRIRVRDGKDIPAVSHREVATSDKGTWKVEITDGDKKILDTIIFELV